MLLTASAHFLPAHPWGPGGHERPRQVGQSEPGGADLKGQAAQPGREAVQELSDAGQRDCWDVSLSHTGRLYISYMVIIPMLLLLGLSLNKMFK